MFEIHPQGRAKVVQERNLFTNGKHFTLRRLLEVYS